MVVGNRRSGAVAVFRLPSSVLTVRDFYRQILDSQLWPCRQDDHLLDDVAELADVARPVVVLERLEGGWFDAGYDASVCCGELLEEA